MVISDWISQYKVCVVEAIEEAGGKGTKALKICHVNIGDNDFITVVTAAPNVRLHSRLVVAPVGATVLDDSGAPLTITKTNVGGVVSAGMFCDSKMLAWDSGGSLGIAAQITDPSIPLGTAPPSSKPRPAHENVATTLPDSDIVGLYAKKLSKAEKKQLNDDKKKARKAAKEAKAKAPAAANANETNKR